MKKMNKYAKYSKPTAELLLQLLTEANYDQVLIDQMLEEVGQEVVKEFQKLINTMVRNGTIDINQPINLRLYPHIQKMVADVERKAWDKRMDTLFSWLNVVYTGSLTRSYKETIVGTFNIFNVPINKQIINNTSVLSTNMPQVIITDTHITSKILPIPWCQDGKTYSQRLYEHVANFQSKLNFVLEEGINKGKGLDWMIEAWRKLTGSTIYDAARLLKTETVAMWSMATKESYLQMGIEYVEIIGDAECGKVCVDYVGEIIPLKEAELGDELPPYHPNCACSYIAFEEDVDKNENNDLLDQED